MYAICKTTHLATEVEHSVYCHFYNFSERNLITASANQLKVYRLIKDASLVGEENFCSDPDEDVNGYNAVWRGVKLECMQSFTLHGNVEALNAVSFVSLPRDCLLLAFADAKLSVVEYDPSTHDLKTISLHYFEEEDMRAGFIGNIRPPVVRVDPENRCAAMLIYGKHIIIVPFRKDMVVEEPIENSFFGVASCSMHNKRSPVLSSYKLELNSEQYGANVVNIVDIQFLHNYYEPTLMILYEPVRTWPGRIAVRQDTVSMITLSLDVHQRVHPHIWSLNNLPYNTFAAMPVPKPIGGVLILANNALIHLNQGLPPFGISLNSFNDSNTSFPLKTIDSLAISLDCSQACFIANNRILFSLHNGDLYMLHLHNDMARSLRTFNFVRLASSVIASTLTKCEEGFAFLGSRLSHSLLLHYHAMFHAQNDELKERSGQMSSQTWSSLASIPKFDEMDKTEDEYLYGNDFCSMQKRLRLENEVNDIDQTSKSLHQSQPIKAEINASENSIQEEMSDSVPLVNGQPEGNENENDSANEDKEIERLHYSTSKEDSDKEDLLPSSLLDCLLQVEQPKENSISSYKLKICDFIYNIGPCTNVCLGEPNVTAENLTNCPEFDVELVSTSGYQQSGAITILQRTIKPQVEASHRVTGCVDTWTVYGPNYYSDDNQLHHQFMILTQVESTIVFHIGQEINELDQSGFMTQSRTVFTGNLGENKYILQVCAFSVRLLDGTHELQHFPVDLGSPIVRTSLADPYSVLMTEDGKVLLLRLKIDSHKGSAHLVISKPDLSTAKSKIVTLCVYKDTSGLFSIEPKVVENFQSQKATNKKQNIVTSSLTSTISNLSTATTVDEEDELLYGDSVIYFGNSNTHENNDDEETDDAKLTTIVKREPTFWLFVVRENGVLEIYNLPDFKLVYLVKNFPLGPRVLVDSIQITDHSYHSQTDSASMPITKEILVNGMGLHQSRPYLFARFEEELFIYEVFPFYESQVENHLKIRFRKITSHCTFLKFPRLVDTVERSQLCETLPASSCWLRPFTNVAGYSGIFLCGPFPCWFVLTHRGELRAHNMEADGMITSFAMFNNVSCPNGFIYFNVDGDLRISSLPSYFELDAQWPYKQVAIGETVHYINYHLESKTYVLVKSKPVQVDRVVRVGGEEKDYDLIEQNARYIPCTTERFQLLLLSPVSWDVIPGTVTLLEEWEHVTSLKNVSLASEGTSTGLKGYIAMGTNYTYGEDVTSRGRIWILDIIEVVPEPGKPLTKNKIKIVYCKEQKGPVTALCQVKGYLLSAIGQKIYIWQLKESQLIGIAFIDTQIYVHTAVSLRNLILIGDVCKSISLLRYQEETRTLSLVSRDVKPLQVYSCEYLIDNTQMSFVVSDSDKNILIYSYQPDSVESFGGTRLLRRADYHFGSNINSFFRIRCNVPHKQMEQRAKQNYLRKHLTMFATLDGSIGYLLPISEKTYRRLLMLQNLLTNNIQHTAGLNPKAFRMVKMRRLELSNPNKNILDGDLLFRFINLALNEKIELAKKIGTSPKQIMDDLQDIHCTSSHY